MKNYFKLKYFLFLGMVLLIILGGFYFNPTKAEAICNVPPTTYPYSITTPGGTCWFDCFGELVATRPGTGGTGCTCNAGFHFDPDSESCVRDSFGLTATPDSCVAGTIDVSWNTVNGATSYTLRDSSTVIYTGAPTVYSHVGLVAGSSHSYTVRSNTSSGSSGYSSPAVVATAPAGATGCTPDLAADAPTPTEFPDGPVDFFSTIRNRGTASTNYQGAINFKNLFQISSLPDGSDIIGRYPGTTIFNLGVGASAATTINKKLPSNANYMRVCADENIAMVGTIDEGPTGENNNCSSWTRIIATNAMSGTLTPASPHCFIIPGLSDCNVNLSWTTTNPEAISSVTSPYPSANTIVATGNSGSQSVTVPYRSRDFYLYNNNQLLDESHATASCADDSSWNGTMCVPDSIGPDLTADVPTPTNATPGAVNFTSTIRHSRNVSTGPVPAFFTNLFQISLSANGSNPTNYAVLGMSALAAGDSAVTSKSIPLSIGVYYLRVCADNNTSFSGVVTESNEGNNCSSGVPWTRIEIMDGTCTDGILNGDEGPLADEGGRCSTGTCTDGIQNGDETGIDTGGRCGGVCLNGANNPDACNECNLPLIYNPISNRCVKKPIFIEI